MYNFVDTVEHTSESILPSEAMQFNGEYLEELIDGYRTLYVKGRDVISPELEIGEVGIRDGGYLKNKRFPPRIITIGYQLLAEDEEAFRAKFNALNDILNVEDAELIFKDEDDKFFIGTVGNFGEVPEGRNNIVSEFEITCADPFKYSVVEHEVTPTADEGTTFVVEYGGTYPAYPVLEADFYTSTEADNRDGECGYVGFVNERGKILQFGTPTETDTIIEKVQNIIRQTTVQTTQITQSKQILTEEFNILGSWANNGYVPDARMYGKSGTLTVDYFGHGSVDRAITAGNYGDPASNNWAGVTACKTLGNLPPVSGATNPQRSTDYIFSYSSRFVVPLKEGTVGVRNADPMCQHAYLLDANNQPIVGIIIESPHGEQTGNTKIVIQGRELRAGQVYLGYTGDKYGFGTDGHWQPGTGITVGQQPKLMNTITKQGNTVIFDLAGRRETYNLPAAVANMIPAKISFYFGAYRVRRLQADAINGVHNCSFIDTGAKYTVSTSSTTENIQYLSRVVDIQNTFGTNDVLVADTSSASVWLGSHSEDPEAIRGLGAETPSLGALGNDWEDFTLVKGTNQIQTSYSDWVEDEYKPTFKLRYRERFL